MANTDNIVSFIAASTISEFNVVRFDADGKIATANSGSDKRIVGIAQRGGVAGDAIDVKISGITRAIAGAGITYNTNPLLMAGASGDLVTCTATNFPIARAIPNINQTSASGANEQIKVLFTGPAVTLS